LTTPLPAPGIYRGVDYATYAAWPALRPSHLKEALSSWAHFRHAETAEESDPTDEMIFGTQVHAALWEPARFHAEFACGPDEAKNSVIWKEAQKATTKTLIKPFAADGKPCWRDLVGMTNAIRKHPVASKIVSLPGESEVCIVWNCSITGEPRKCRIDRLIKRANGYLIVDYKSTRNASPRKFASQAHELGYDVSAADYVDAVRSATGAEEVAFAWIAGEKDAPYVCAVYSSTDAATSPDFLTNGRRRRDRLMRGLAECRKTGVYPGYSDKIEPLRVPAYGIEDETL